MKKQLNILLVSSKYMPEYSGSGYRAHHLYKRLADNYQDIYVTVLCGSTTENTCDAYEYDGVQVNRVAGKTYKKLSSSRIIRTMQVIQNYRFEAAATRHFLKQLKGKIDLIHIFGECYPSAEVLNYARTSGIPVLVEICNEVDSPYQYIPFPFKLWKSTRLNSKMNFVCISENLRQMCLNHGVTDDKIWCRPNPVDENRFHPVKHAEKLKLRNTLTKFTDKDTVICYIAKFRPSKNHRFLVEIMTKLPDNYKLFMKGPLVESGPLAERDQQVFQELKQQIKDRNLAQRIELHAGFCDNVDDYYKMADVYAFPSITEGLGTPILESLACGVPVVANLIPNTTDIWIKNGQNGFLSVLEPEEFSAKLCKATLFSNANCTKEAAAILDVAGTKIIDEKYYKLILELVKKQ